MAARVAWMPHWLYAQTVQLILRLNVGDYADYGLQRPTGSVLSTHVTLNSELLYYLRHGKITPRRDVARFDGQTVHFVDGQSQDYDVVIAATGFRISFPFLDPAIMDYSEGQDVPLYLLMMHPEHPSLFVIGLVQPLGCIWPLSDLQAKIAANAIIGNYRPPATMRAQIERDINQRRRQFVAAKRHNVEVEYLPFRRRLLREVPANAPEWRGVPQMAASQRTAEPA